MPTHTHTHISSLHADCTFNMLTHTTPCMLTAPYNHAVVRTLEEVPVCHLRTIVCKHLACHVICHIMCTECVHIEPLISVATRTGVPSSLYSYAVHVHARLKPLDPVAWYNRTWHFHQPLMHRSPYNLLGNVQMSILIVVKMCTTLGIHAIHPYV